MQSQQINHAAEFAHDVSAPTFSSVWGNEMQREDFLALAAGLRQFNAYGADLPLAAGLQHEEAAGF